jgi:type IV pilus assembly protein PilC
MTSYAYTAINAQGMELRGEIEAADVESARDQLRAKGLLPQELKSGGGAAKASTRSRRKKVKPKAMQVFARQFATMIESGLSIVQALVVLEQQTDDKVLTEIITEVRAEVETGLMLSQAMAKHPQVFNRLYIAMVEAGEAAGILDQVLDRVAVQIEKETKIKRRVKGAMIYPLVVMSFATAVLVGMLLFLVPIFVKVFADMGGDLPMLTKIVLGASNGLKAYWFIIIPLFGFGIFGLKRWKRSEGGRRTWDRLRLRLPMKIGDVVLKVTIARFSRTLSTLVAAGVDIITALEITEQTAGNSVIEEALADVRTRVQEGARFAEPLTDNDVFPPMVSQMVKVGEETGELEKMLAKVADFYEDEVDASIQSLTSIVEPIMMLGVGVIVGIVIISMYMPMFKLLTLIE